MAAGSWAGRPSCAMSVPAVSSRCGTVLRFTTCGAVLRFTTWGAVLRFAAWGAVLRFAAWGTVLRFTTWGTVLRFTTCGTVLRFTTCGAALRFTTCGAVLRFTTWGAAPSSICPPEHMSSRRHDCGHAISTRARPRDRQRPGRARGGGAPTGPATLGGSDLWPAEAPMMRAGSIVYIC